MSPVVDGGGSQERCAPSGDFEILIADGAPGNPGRQVLNGATSLHSPRPQLLMAATRNRYAQPGSRFILLYLTKSGRLSAVSVSPSYRQFHSSNSTKLDTVCDRVLKIPTVYHFSDSSLILGFASSFSSFALALGPRTAFIVVMSLLPTAADVVVVPGIVVTTVGTAEFNVPLLLLLRIFAGGLTGD